MQGSSSVAEVEVTELRASFSDTVNRVAYGKERLVVTRHGKEMVALVPIEDMRLLEALEDRIDLEEARAALVEAKTQETVPWEKVKEGLGL
jgi:prevent-host-death family protein